VAGEVVKVEADVAALLLHLLAEVTDPPVQHLSSLSQTGKVEYHYSSNNTTVIHAFLLFQ
jgi:hypothetical protein